MAQDDLALLFSIKKGTNAIPGIAAESRAALASLRTDGAASLGALEKAGAAAFQNIGNRVNGLTGGMLQGLTTQLQLAAGASEQAATGIAGLAGPVGIAVIGIAALTAAGVALTKEFIDLTVSTADWQGKLFDLSQQVGISTETLSAFEVMATTTGGSLDQVVASLGIFQKNMEDARDPTTKQATAFKDLGVIVTDTEQTLRDTIRALAAMETGSKQTNAALELFGRGGKSVLAIAKETNGDLDATIKKLREMGLVVSGDAAKAADEFNDSLAVLQFQIRATTATLVQDSIPQILEGLKAVQKIITENQEAFSLVRNAITIFATGNAVLLLGTLKLIETAWLGVKGATDAATFGLASYFAKQAAAPGIADAGGGLSLNLPPRASGGELVLGAGITRPKGAGGRGGGAAKVSEGQRLLNSLIEEYDHLLAKKNDLDKLDIVNQELLSEKYRDIDPKIKARILANAWLIKGVQDEEAAQKANTEANKGYLEVIKNIREEMNRNRAARIEIEGRIAEAVQDQREALSELQGFEKTHLQAVEEYIASAVKQAEAVGGVTAKMKEYFAILIQIAAKEDEITANRKRFEGVEGDAEGGSTKPIRSTASSIDQLFSGINDNLTGNTQQTALAGLSALTEGFGQLGQALGSAAAAWILYGDSGTSARKMVAEVLAGITQMAVVKSVWEFAEGLAQLALAFLGWPQSGPSAAAHFAASAAYAGIAGVSAGLGRSIAGNSFAPNGGANGGGSSRSTSNQNGTNQQLQPIDLERQRGPQAIHLVIEHRSGGLFESHVVKAVVNDAELGGDMRQLMIREIKRQE